MLGTLFDVDNYSLDSANDIDTSNQMGSMGGMNDMSNLSLDPANDIDASDAAQMGQIADLGSEAFSLDGGGSASGAGISSALMGAVGDMFAAPPPPTSQHMQVTSSAPPQVDIRPSGIFGDLEAQRKNKWGM